jgi:hypothetical protein
MAFKRTESEEAIHMTSGNTGREVRVTKEFNDLLNENPEIVADFLEIIKKLKLNPCEAGSVLEDDNKNIRVEVIEHLKEDPYYRRPEGYYLRVQFGKHDLFIKNVPGFENDPQSMGASELQTAIELKNVVRSAGLEKVEVADFKLGYQDEKGNTLFMSKWVKGIRLDFYFEQLNKNSAKAEVISQRFEEIRGALKGFNDVSPKNMIYDPDTDIITIFDIHKLD